MDPPTSATSSAAPVSAGVAAIGPIARGSTPGYTDLMLNLRDAFTPFELPPVERVIEAVIEDLFHKFYTINEIFVTKSLMVVQVFIA